MDSLTLGLLMLGIGFLVFIWGVVFSVITWRSQESVRIYFAAALIGAALGTTGGIISAIALNSISG